jgi:hypothetical protein
MVVHPGKCLALGRIMERFLSSEVPLPPVETNVTHGVHGEGGAGHPFFQTDPTSGGVFLFFALVLGAAVRAFNRFVPVPYTIVLLILGILLGILDANVP